MDNLGAPAREPVDVVNQHTGERWYYSDIVKEHFFNPRNLLLDDPKDGEFNASGIVGSPACGDVMRIWMKIDPDTERVKDLKWRTFGCGSAIAATSMFSVMVTEDGGLWSGWGDCQTVKSTVRFWWIRPSTKPPTIILGE
ncbi:MAG: Nitrogen-fixing NifU domain protein [Parcubacteria group bacterium GW2011_GWA1_51_12]|nr:MAG: Nitrogen-fixing NifU domain protein [Parcubacteria group bacterium GW2011_GWA1_51_12]